MVYADYLTGTEKSGQEQQSSCQQLEDLLESCAIGFNAIAPDGTILEANKAELELLGYAADEYVGHQIIEFHADQHATSNMLDRLSRGERLDRYPARIRAKDQSTKHVEITSNPQFKDGRFLGARCLTIDVTQAVTAELQLSDLDIKSRQLLDAMPIAIYTTDADGRVTYCNEAAADLAGRRPELFHDRWCVTWRLYHPDGSPCPLESCPMAITLRENRPVRGVELIAERPDGTRLRVLPFPTPLCDETGKLVGAVNLLVDISDRKQAEQTREVLIGELNHRVKNTLATVQAIAHQSLRHTRDPDQFVAGFTGRIQALARVHALLAANAWRGIELSTLMRLQIGAARSARVGWSGREAHVQPQVATNLALILHELASQAEKFGALTAPGRQLRVEWSIESTSEGRVLNLDWTETGGVPWPPASGLGSTLIEQIARASGGSAAVTSVGDGIRWNICLPLPADSNWVDAAYLNSETASRQSVRARANHSVLRGARILVVEDEPLIALELSRILTDAGMQVAGITPTVTQARRIMDAGGVSVAILDANLDGHEVDDAAARLSCENVPFVFVSGYGREILPAAFRNRPLISKPFTSRQVLDTLAAALSEAEAPAPLARSQGL